MSTTLVISHYLHLTKEERYRWYNGEEFEIVGVSTPVWFYKGVSSEPAVEIFCKYKLLTDGDDVSINNTQNKYEVVVPRKPVIKTLPPPDEIWSLLTLEQQENWHMQNPPTLSLINLLDIKDGGSEYIAFRQSSKIKKDKKILNVVHFVEIKDIKVLLDTLI